MQLNILTTVAQIEELIAYLEDKTYVAFDTETTGLTKRHEIIGMSVAADENTAYYIILSAWDVATASLVRTPGITNVITMLLQLLKTKDLITHNGTFDCMMVEAYYKVSLINSIHTDTMILAHLLDENRRVGLKDLSATLFGESSTKEQKEMKDSVLANGGKLTKDTYEMYKADAQLLAKYGAKDALLTMKLFLHLVPELYDQGLDKFFYEEESMPLLRGSTYQLNTIGLSVDTAALTNLKKTLEAECQEAKAFILKEIAPHINEKYPGTKKTNVFNIGSSQQLSWLCFGKLGLEFNTLTKAGKAVAKEMGLKHYSPAEKRRFIQACLDAKEQVLTPEFTHNGVTKKATKVKDPWAYIACDKEALKKHSHKYKWIEKLLEYQRKMKILSTYVEGIEERVEYGIIQPSFLQHGTTSGRYSSRNPNFQNLPRDDKRIKSCIVARPGKVFVGADYSQLEPRVFAYTSKDPRLMDAFKGSDDFYSVIGMEVYDKTDCTPKKEGSPDAFGIKYKKLRDLSKVIALATVYGATAYQLMKTTGKNIEDTQADIDAYLERFPGVAQMMLDAHKLAKETGRVTNLFGRPRRMPEAKYIPKQASHADLPYEARKLLNLAVNHTIQSTAASIVNRAAIKFNILCQTAGIDCQLVVQVHDSLVAECSKEDAENVSLLLQTAMEDTTVLEGVALEAVPKIGTNLAEV